MLYIRSVAELKLGLREISLKAPGDYLPVPHLVGRRVVQGLFDVRPTLPWWAPG